MSYVFSGNTWSCLLWWGQMVTVLHTSIVLNLPLEMWINVFHNADGNETRGRYVICRLFWTDIRIAPSSWRCTWNIPDLSFANFSFFLWVVSQGSRRSHASGPSITETSTQSRPCRLLCLPSQQAQWHVAEKWMHTVVFIWLFQQNQMTCVIVLPTRSPAAQALWETMLTSKHKEGVMEVRRHLVETASKEKLPIKMSMGKKQVSDSPKIHKEIFSNRFERSE